MNPHYTDYHNEDPPQAPADNLNPIPIKFLAVQTRTIFIFRLLVPKDSIQIRSMAEKALRNALEKEGVGAKTAVGYGVFSIIEAHEPEKLEKAFQTRLEEEAEQESLKQLAGLSEEEIKEQKILTEIHKLAGDTGLISDLANRCLKEDYSSTIYKKLKEKLLELEEWFPMGSKKRKVKMKERNRKIEEKI